MLKIFHPSEQRGQMRISWENWEPQCWGLWKHTFVPGESASQGDKHHQFLQEEANLAQGLSSWVSLMPDPSPFCSVLFPTTFFRQWLISVLAFTNPICKCPPHPTSLNLSPSFFSSARGCAMGTGQKTGHGTVLQMVQDVAPDRAVRVDEAGAAERGSCLAPNPCQLCASQQWIPAGHLRLPHPAQPTHSS